ncbi:MAG: hypothetical protein ACE5H9_21945 [Anaerolineae bacterium]
MAATMEELVSHADLVARRTSPFPPQIRARLRAQMDEQSRLDWDAPVCGIIRP